MYAGTGWIVRTGWKKKKEKVMIHIVNKLIILYIKSAKQGKEKVLFCSKKNWCFYQMAYDCI